MAYSSIVKPTDYFNTVLYTGTGSSQDISVGFQTDWTWIKDRDSTENHNIFDTVRTATKRISSNRTNAEDTQAQQLTAFGSNGFTVGTDSGANHSGRNYVSWNWLAGGTASSNTDGDITSSVSVNTTAGFSIVSYTGNGSNSTIGHGLGAVPRWIIVKVRDATNNWVVQHGSLGATKRMLLDTTNASASASTFFNNTEPTSSVFTVGTEDITNNSGSDFIAYCFAEKKGYSKFGSYTGNGNANGTFTYTGFKPAFLMFKVSSTTENWYIIDNKRAPNNDSRNYPDFIPLLYPNLNNAEGFLNDEVDLYSNGFKPRGTNSAHNTSGATYIYMAFAENPFVANDSGTAVPVTAR